MKAVKLLTCSAAHQFRILLREFCEDIHHLQSPPGRNLRLFLKTPTRCQGIDAQWVFLEEAGDQHIPEQIFDHLGAILVGDGV